VSVAGRGGQLEIVAVEAPRGDEISRDERFQAIALGRTDGDGR